MIYKACSLLLLLLGFFLVFWGGFCLLGGPDGRPLGPTLLTVAGICFSLGAACLWGCRRLVPMSAWVFLPMLPPVLGAAVIAIGERYIGASIGVFGMFVTMLGCGIRWIFVVLRV